MLVGGSRAGHDADLPGDEFDDCAGMNASISQGGVINKRSYVGVRWWWREGFASAKFTWKIRNAYRALTLYILY